MLIYMLKETDDILSTQQMLRHFNIMMPHVHLAFYDKVTLKLDAICSDFRSGC